MSYGTGLLLAVLGLVVVRAIGWAASGGTVPSGHMAFARGMQIGALTLGLLVQGCWILVLLWHFGGIDHDAFVGLFGLTFAWAATFNISGAVVGKGARLGSGIVLGSPDVVLV